MVWEFCVPIVAVLFVVVRVIMPVRLEAESHNESDYFVEDAIYAASEKYFTAAGGKIGSMTRADFVHQWHGESTTKAAGVVYDAWLDAKIQSLIRTNPGF